MNMLVVAGILLALGLALAILEIFIPSGGLFGFLSIVAIVASIVLAFREGIAEGLVFLIVACVGVPSVVAVALKVWPQTPMGRRILLSVPTSEEVLPDNEQSRKLRSLVGKAGKATCAMLPSGAVEIEGRLVNAVADGISIEPGQLVRVFEVRGNRVVVRPVEGDADETTAGERLSQPIDTLGLDPFQEPLA